MPLLGNWILPGIGPGGVCRIAGECAAAPHRTRFEIAFAVRTDTIERTVGAIIAEGAFEGTDERAGLVRRQVAVAVFAVGAHFEHDQPRLRQASTRRVCPDGTECRATQ